VLAKRPRSCRDPLRSARHFSPDSTRRLAALSCRRGSEEEPRASPSETPVGFTRLTWSLQHRRRPPPPFHIGNVVEVVVRREGGPCRRSCSGVPLRGERQEEAPLRPSGSFARPSRDSASLAFAYRTSWLVIETRIHHSNRALQPNAITSKRLHEAHLLLCSCVKPERLTSDFQPVGRLRARTWALLRPR